MVCHNVIQYDQLIPYQRLKIPKE